MERDPEESRRDQASGGVRRPPPKYPPIEVGEDGRYLIPRGEEARARMAAFHKALIEFDRAAELWEDDPELDAEILKALGVPPDPAPDEPGR